MRYKLGDIEFEGLLAPNTLALDQEERISVTPLLSGGSDIQRTGTNPTALNLELRLHYSFTDVRGSINRISDVQETGEALEFVDADGYIYGSYYIQARSVSITMSDRYGRPSEATVALTLIEAGDNAGFSTLLPLADSPAGLPVSALSPRALTPSALMITSQTAGMSAAAEARRVLSRATSSGGDTSTALRRVANLYAEAEESFRTAAGYISQVQSVVSLSTSIGQAAQDAVSAAANATALARAGDLTGTSAAATLVDSAADLFFTLAAPLRLAAIFRRV